MNPAQCLSMRTIGVMVMVHGDDKARAPTQDSLCRTIAQCARMALSSIGNQQMEGANAVSAHLAK